MIRIEPEAWAAMVSHAREVYPNECCGAMIGSIDGDAKTVRVAMRLENAFAGCPQSAPRARSPPSFQRKFLRTSSRSCLHSGHSAIALRSVLNGQIKMAHKRKTHQPLL